MKTIYKNEEVLKRENLICRIHDMVKIPDVDGYMLFDDSDYQECPCNEYKENQAFYLNIKCDGVVECSPSYILELANRMDCEHFIWVSKRIGDGDNVNLVWVYSHELQHLVHSVASTPLHLVGSFLHKAYHYIDQKKKVLIDIPTEFDCERTAKRVVTELFGEARCSSYIDQQIGKSNQERVYEKMKDVDPFASYDVAAKTIDFLCRHKRQCESVRNTVLSGSKFSKLNIDEICAERDLDVCVL